MTIVNSPGPTGEPWIGRGAAYGEGAENTCVAPSKKLCPEAEAGGGAAAAGDDGATTAGGQASGAWRGGGVEAGEFLPASNIIVNSPAGAAVTGLGAAPGRANSEGAGGNPPPRSSPRNSRAKSRSMPPAWRSAPGAPPPPGFWNINVNSPALPAEAGEGGGGGGGGGRPAPGGTRNIILDSLLSRATGIIGAGAAAAGLGGRGA